MRKRYKKRQEIIIKMNSNKRISGADESENITDNSYMAKKDQKNPSKHAHVSQFQQEIKPSENQTEVKADIRNQFESGNRAADNSHHSKGTNKLTNFKN